MALRILETMKALAVNPPAVGFIRFEFHLQHAGFMIGLVMRFPDAFRRGILPGGGPALGLIRHFLAEGDFDLRFAGGNVLGSGLRHGFDDDRRDGIHGLRTAGLRRELASRTDDAGGEQCFCFHTSVFIFGWSKRQQSVAIFSSALNSWTLPARERRACRSSVRHSRL